LTGLFFFFLFILKFNDLFLTGIGTGTGTGVHHVFTSFIILSLGPPALPRPRTERHYSARAEKFQTSSEQRRREKSTRKRPRGTSEQMNGLTK
jgi:hypothetical protein